MEESSDKDRDDNKVDEDDKLKDLEQTGAMATRMDMEESLMSEGKLCAMPKSEPRAMGTDNKWVTEP